VVEGGAVCRSSLPNSSLAWHPYPLLHRLEGREHLAWPPEPAHHHDPYGGPYPLDRLLGDLRKEPATTRPELEGYPR